MKKINYVILALSLLLCCFDLKAEDGSRLWLRAEKNAQQVQPQVKLKGKKDATLQIARDEILQYWKGKKVLLCVTKDGKTSDGFDIFDDGKAIHIESATSLGVLYGAYTLLRMQAMDQALQGRVSETPCYDIRILNHWDNPNGTVERGFAGRSIFWKDGAQSQRNHVDATPNQVDGLTGASALLDETDKASSKKAQLSPEEKVWKAYARANASIGINASVLNNVNAKPLMLGEEKLQETKRIADVLRPYGIKVYLSVNFASPKALGGLPTADPLDKDVRQWWKDKADEIYRLIPDFGGFLVKANSEGEPGPMDYGRTHVDGANMLAEALAPHDGIVMWRAFVYSATGSDRAAQAVEEFMPYDGKFANNVIIQIKNGPVDFQPREPVSPLLMSMKQTKTMIEVQITQEYLGESVHSVFLAPMWRECFDTLKAPDGFANFEKHEEGRKTAFAGVANIGDSRNWCGSDMAQANWYAFGRLAWNPNLSSEQIAREFLMQTFSKDTGFVSAMTRVMCDSRETCVKYMMPLGLHHIFAGGRHYGPEPWYAPNGVREDWLPRFYHKADAEGLGFDRTVETGSGATKQYPPSLFSLYNDINKCPDNLILWFHHVKWNHVMRNGKTLWNNLCLTYEDGVKEAEAQAEVWRSMKPYVDADRWNALMQRYDRQARDAWWWRDACVLYFQQFSKLPLPDGYRPAKFKLEDLMRYRLRMDNYTAADMNKLP